MEAAADDQESGHCSIVHVVPLAFAAAASMLRFVFTMRVMIMLPLNVALRTSFLPSFGFGNLALCLVIISEMWKQNVQKKAGMSPYFDK